MFHRLITSLLAALAVSVFCTVPLAPPSGAARGPGMDSFSPERPAARTAGEKVSLPALQLSGFGPAARRLAGGSLGAAARAPRLRITTTSLPKATIGATYSATLTASGGRPPYFWKVIGRYPLPPGIHLSRTGRLFGSPTESGYEPFTVRVVDSSRPTRQVARASLSITTPSPPTRTTDPPNWSGDADVGKSFTSVIGTFNVPSLRPSSGPTTTSEWVGIDGATNSSLIQAGVTEMYDPTTKSVSTYAWWEILPAANTPIQMSVSTGDLCTVTIYQVSGSTWDINLEDNTSGQTFNTEQSYYGPRTSMEWIVEAPLGASGKEDVLGQYTPDVEFTNMRATGLTITSARLIMKQNGVPVSTPSSLTGVWGITVRYGAVTPSPPPNRPLP
jgi:hypothetical protein